MAQKATEVKVVLLGDTGVGKSSLVLRFVTNNFKPFSESTIGASFMSKVIMVGDQPIKYQIWDTAGQEKYHSLAPMYYRGAAAAIVVYDITRAESFKTLQNWIKELRQCGPEGIIIAIAGNKADLEDKREVQSDMAKRYAQKLEDERGMGQSALFFETSAKEDLNVKAIFEMISQRLPSPEEPAEAVQRLDAPVKGSSGKKGGCC